MHVTRQMVRVLTLSLLVFALAQIGGASNFFSSAPLPAGTTIRLSSPPNPKAGSKTPIDVQLRNGPENSEERRRSSSACSRGKRARSARS